MPLVNAADFRERVQQELARAQRYCLYLSLLVLDLSELAELSEADARQLERIPANLPENLNSVLRCSDLIAVPQGNRLIVLLVETPASGLEIVADRIRNFVHDYLEGQTATPPARALPIHTAVYPDTTEDFTRLLSSLRVRTQITN